MPLKRRPPIAWPLRYSGLRRMPARWAASAHWRLRCSVGATTVMRSTARRASSSAASRSANDGLACARCCRGEKVTRLGLEVEVEGFRLPRAQLVGGSARGPLRVGGRQVLRRERAHVWSAHVASADVASADVPSTDLARTDVHRVDVHRVVVHRLDMNRAHRLRSRYVVLVPHLIRRYRAAPTPRRPTGRLWIVWASAPG